MPAKIAAVVVTHNRKALLGACLNALARQTLKPDWVTVIDNASSDGTADMLRTATDASGGFLRHQRLSENLGGAGGFSAGLAHAIEQGADWIWMMDDDAEPLPDALQVLMDSRPHPMQVLASVPQRDGTLAWPVTWRTLRGEPGGVAHRVAELPCVCTVETHPFLGFMIHRDLADCIGLPDARLYISADDIEYSLRARAHGASITLVRDSLISHPISTTRYYSILGRRIALLSLPPWRRYYDTRNRLLVARRHHGFRLWTHALPGTLIRILLIAMLETRKSAQLKSAFAGAWDGIRGVSGKRHEKWNLER